MKTLKTKYFYGNEISKYGQENGYLDYATLSKAFDAVLVNDITKLFYATINGEYNEPEKVNGIIDNSEEIDELKERIEELEESNESMDPDEIADRVAELEEQIEELEREQNEPPEIFQYYIISNYGAEILKEFTNDPVYYIPVLDCYVWGVTHYGTGWAYVLTDIKIEVENNDY